MKKLVRNLSKLFYRIIIPAGIFRISLILISFLLCGGLRAQKTQTISFKNSIFISESYYLKIEGKSSRFLIMADYRRSLYNRNLFSLSGQIGLGFFNRNQGEDSGIYGILNLRTFINSYLGNQKHKFLLGLGGQIYYHHHEILIATGYQLEINRTVSLNLAVSHWLWQRYSFDNQFYDSSGSPRTIIIRRIWDEKLNDLFLILGLGFNF